MSFSAMKVSIVGSKAGLGKHSKAISARCETNFDAMQVGA